MIKIISTHENATAIFDNGVLATVKKEVQNPIEYIIDFLENREDSNSQMILGLIDEAIAHDTLYYSQEGVIHHYRLI